MAEILSTAQTTNPNPSSKDDGTHGDYYGTLDHSFKAVWAKRRVEEKIAEFFNSRPENNLALTSLREPLQGEVKPGDSIPIGDKRKTGLPGQRVCIIGAGVAGLFTAMTIDYLNKEVPGLDVKYEILEAAGEDRFGGRLYTHKFSKDNLHDYYDVGAMRFPAIPIMKRTFDLFEKVLGFERYLEPLKLPPKGLLPSPPRLIPYHLTGKNCPYYFNDIQYSKAPEKENDPFRVQSKKPDDKIPQEFLEEGSGGPTNALRAAIEPFKRALRYDIDKKLDNGPGWKLLMKADAYSVRQYLSRLPIDIDVLPEDGIEDFFNKGIEDPPLPKGPGYNYRTIEWIETFSSGTLNFDEAFSEAVLGSLDFDYYSGNKKQDVEWWCIEGGTQQVASEMKERIQHQEALKYNSRVTMIKLNPYEIGEDDDKMVVRVGPPKDDEDQEDHREYAAVFNSTTLAAMQRMDLTGAVLNYETKVAIRALRYGVSCKIGVKFKEAWWLNTPLKIVQGGIGYTDLPLRVCVYPSYNINDTTGEAVLLCSYTWGQDAQRLSSLISKQGQETDEELKEIIFNNLALLHATQKDGKKDLKVYKDLYQKIKTLYVTHHAYDWGADPFMSGAFAHFGPGQFSRMYPDIITPQAGGRLFIIGEAASKHHAWIVGALESAVRGVYQLMKGFKDPEAIRACEIFEEKDLDRKPSDKHSPFGPLPYEEDEKTAAVQFFVSAVREEDKREVPAKTSK